MLDFLEKEHVLDEDVNSLNAGLSSEFEEMRAIAVNSVLSIKKRIMLEKENALIEAARSFAARSKEAQNEIDSLHAEISQLSERNSVAENATTANLCKSLAMLERFHDFYRSSSSVLRIFRAWKDQVRNTKTANKMDCLSKKMGDKMLTQKMFYLMASQFMRRKANAEVSGAKQKFDSITNEMIEKYETEIKTLRENLAEAYSAANTERNRRQQLEEDLRRLFLKNITAMNFEALSLFQSAQDGDSSSAAAAPVAAAGVAAPGSSGNENTNINTAGMLSAAGPPSGFMATHAQETSSMSTTGKSHQHKHHHHHRHGHHGHSDSSSRSHSSSSSSSKKVPPGTSDLLNTTTNSTTFNPPPSQPVFTGMDRDALPREHSPPPSPTPSPLPKYLQGRTCGDPSATFQYSPAPPSATTPPAVASVIRDQKAAAMQLQSQLQSEAMPSLAAMYTSSMSSTSHLAGSPDNKNVSSSGSILETSETPVPAATRTTRSRARDATTAQDGDKARYSSGGARYSGAKPLSTKNATPNPFGSPMGRR